MTSGDVYLQQLINGLSNGSIYALLALGFTLVYGILELINFAHFSVFMVGSFIGLGTLGALGVNPNDPALTGLWLAVVLLVTFAVTMVASGLLGVGIERIALRPLRHLKGQSAMITTIGVSYVLLNLVLLGLGADAKNFPTVLAPIQFAIGGAVLRLREILIWVVSFGLMGALTYFVQYTKLGKAMRATAQDADAARMMGVEVDRVIVAAFFLGSALAGAAGLMFGMYFGFTSYVIGFNTGLAAFVGAVLGGIGSVPGAMLGGILIGVINAFASYWVSASWADVIIFTLFVLVLVFKPAGLLGRVAPNKS